MKSRAVLLATALVVSQGCYKSHPPGSGDPGGEDTCHPTVTEDDSYYNRFEAPDADNRCRSHRDCSASGCSGEICAAEAMGSTCEGLPRHPEGTCGCVDRECQWYVGECSP